MNLGQIEAEFGGEVLQQYRPILNELVADGLLAISDEQIALTLRGRMLSNDVFARFLDVVENPEPASV